MLVHGEYTGHRADGRRRFKDLPTPGGGTIRTYATGDAGRSSGGRIFIEGRLDRVARVHGGLLDLRDVERLACAEPAVLRATARISHDDLLFLAVLVPGVAHAALAPIRDRLVQRLGGLLTAHRALAR